MSRRATVCDRSYGRPRRRGCTLPNRRGAMRLQKWILDRCERKGRVVVLEHFRDPRAGGYRPRLGGYRGRRRRWRPLEGRGRQGVATGHRLRRQGRQPRPATQVARMETPKVPDEACGPSRSLHGGRIAEDRAGVLRWRAPPSKKRFRRYGVDQRIFSYFEGPLTL